MLPSGARYINVYFNGLGVGLSYDIDSAYASGSYAMMKSNNLIDMANVTSVDISVTSNPLYAVNNLCSLDNNEFVCNGTDLSDNFAYVDLFRGTLTITGTNILGETVTFDTDVAFSQEDLENGYKDFWMPTLLINVSSICFRIADNQVLGDGFFTLRLCKKSLARIAYQSFKTFTRDTFATISSGGAGAVVAAIDVINTLFDFASYEPNFNAFVGQVSMCSRYADILNGNTFDSSITWDIIEGIAEETIELPESLAALYGDDHIEANQTYVQAINYIDFTAILYPKFRIEINSGFEFPESDESWCCDVLDTSTKCYQGGNTTVEPEPIALGPLGGDGGESGQGGGESGGEGGQTGGGSSGDDCICDYLLQIKLTLEGKLTMINDSLVAIKEAIQALRLECNTTVQPSTAQINVQAPQVTVTPEINVAPCQPVVTNPVNNITVEPCQPIVTNPVNQITVTPSTAQITNPVTVQPCSPVVNPTDTSGIESALQGITSQLASGLNSDSDGLWCEDSFGGKQSIACILKEALIRDGEKFGCYNNVGIAEILHESLNKFGDKGHCEGESITSILDKSFNKHDDCCDEDIHLIDTLTTVNSETGCDNETITDVLKDKDIGQNIDVTVTPDELVQIRRVYYNEDEG